jgi:hypothetical protein
MQTGRNPGLDKPKPGRSARRIAKARGWIIRLGLIASFAEIAEREVQGERHNRLLALLAFLSPHNRAENSHQPTRCMH